jgi:RNA polymerase sigma factor (sigma-70 family)
MQVRSVDPSARHTAVERRQSYCDHRGPDPKTQTHPSVWVGLDHRRSRLINIARQYGISIPDAEDVVSEAVLRIATWRRTDQSSIDQLASTVVRRLCLDELRRRKRESECLRRIGSEKDAESAEADVCDRAAACCAVRAIASVLTLAELKVILLAMDGHDHADIAAQLGITIRASQVALSRARIKIRKSPTALRAFPTSRRIESGGRKTSRN